MSCGFVTKIKELRVTATSTQGIFYPTGAWAYGPNMQKVRGTIRLIAPTGDIEVRPAFQTATAVVNEGGSGGRGDWQGFDNWRTAPDEIGFDGSLNIGINQFARPGIEVRLSQSGPPAQSDVLVQWSWRSCVSRLGRFSTQAHIGGNTSEAILPCSDWFAALDIEVIRGAVVVQGVQGSLVTQAAIQTADVDPNSPNAWQLLGTSVAGSRKDCVEHNVDAILNPVSGPKPMFARLGTAFALQTGTAEAFASLATDWCGRRG